MAVLTTQAQLEEVQTAITAVMANQSWKSGDITYTRASLSSLQAREEMLLARLRRESRGGVISRANFEGGL